MTTKDSWSAVHHTDVIMIMLGILVNGNRPHGIDRQGGGQILLDWCGCSLPEAVRRANDRQSWIKITALNGSHGLWVADDDCAAYLILIKALNARVHHVYQHIWYMPIFSKKVVDCTPEKVINTLPVTTVILYYRQTCVHSDLRYFIYDTLQTTSPFTDAVINEALWYW